MEFAEASVPDKCEDTGGPEDPMDAGVGLDEGGGGSVGCGADTAPEDDVDTPVGPFAPEACPSSDEREVPTWLATEPRLMSREVPATSGALVVGCNVWLGPLPSPPARSVVLRWSVPVVLEPSL